MSRFIAFLLVLLVAVSATACGRPPMQKVNHRASNCIGLMDDLKTLRVGDELPRVVQVMGLPDKAERSRSLFGTRHDVLVYKLADTNVCARTMLDIEEDENLMLAFDGKGGYVGYGQAAVQRAKGFWTVSTTPLLLDPVVLRP